MKGYRYNSVPGSCEKFEVQLSARWLRWKFRGTSQCLVVGVKYLRHKSVLDSWGERFEVQVSVMSLV